MKPFDLDAAQRGEPICFTENGKPLVVRFIGTMESGAPVVEMDGKPHIAGKLALFMAPKKRTVWINLHKQRDTGDITPFLYDDEAYANRQRGNSMNCLGTFPIEIED